MNKRNNTIRGVLLLVAAALMFSGFLMMFIKSEIEENPAVREEIQKIGKQAAEMLHEERENSNSDTQ